MTCRIRVVAGDVEVRLEHPEHPGRCTLPARAERLLTLAAALATSIDVPTAPEPETPPTVIGFSASLERAEPVEPDLSWYFDE